MAISFISSDMKIVSDSSIRKQTQLPKIKYQNPPKRMEDEPNIILRENTIGHDMSNMNPLNIRANSNPLEM